MAYGHSKLETGNLKLEIADWYKVTSRGGAWVAWLRPSEDEDGAKDWREWKPYESAGM
jgi:hypothetical protein